MLLTCRPRHHVAQRRRSHAVRTAAKRQKVESKRLSGSEAGVVAAPGGVNEARGDASQPSKAEDSAAGQLPKEQVLSACLRTSGIIAAAGGAMILVQSFLPLHPIVAAEPLVDQPTLQLLTGVAAGLLVTSSRTALTAVWPELEAANSRANALVLRTVPEMTAADVCVVACVPAIAEEVLFRGGLVGLLGASVPAAVVAGVVFGALHVSSGQDLPRGAFATAAGVLYGLVYVATGSVFAAIAGHCAGNVTSAAVWLASQRQGEKSEQSDS